MKKEVVNKLFKKHFGDAQGSINDHPNFNLFWTDLSIYQMILTGELFEKYDLVHPETGRLYDVAKFEVLKNFERGNFLKHYRLITKGTHWQYIAARRKANIKKRREPSKEGKMKPK